MELRPWTARLPYAVSALAAVALVATLLASFARGFDWSDEGFYLNWMSFPWDFSASLTMFGFVYHPLYLLAGGNIVLLRSLNLIATIVLAAILTGLVAPVRSPGTSAEGRWFTAWSCLAVGALVLVFYKFGPPTPSYNSLNLQGLLVTTIGVVLLQRSRWEATGGWVLLALGLSLCFLAKAPTAAAAGVFVVAYFLLVRGTRNLPRKGILVGVSSLIGCLLLAAIVIDGSPIAFVRRLIVEREHLALMHTGHSLSLVQHVSGWRLGLNASWKRIFFWLVLAASGAVLAWWSWRGRAVPSRIHGWVAGVLIAGLLWSLLSLWGIVPAIEAFRRRAEDFTLLAVPAGVFAAACVLLAFGPASSGARDRLGLAALLFALPFAYAYGSGMPLLLQGANAGFFWCLSGLVLLQERDCRILYVQMMQIFVVLLIAAHLDRPYRESQPIFAPKVAVPIPWQGGGEVYLTPDSASYARTLAQLAEQAGLRPRMPLLDFTGNYPGAAYFLSSKPAGAPWIMGIFDGAERYLRELLLEIPCEELAQAWVLTASNEETALSPRLLEAHGIVMSEAMAEVGSLISPIEYDQHSLRLLLGNLEVRYTQTLYKPIRPSAQAAAACRAARQHHPP